MEVLRYLNSLGRQTILAIDEFQMIAGYKETVPSENHVRNVVQTSPNVRMICVGSEGRGLAEIFFSTRRPFYQSATPMHPDVIQESEYHDFAKNRFAKINRALSPEVFASVYAEYRGSTWYIHSILNALYNLREGRESMRSKRSKRRWKRH